MTDIDALELDWPAPANLLPDNRTILDTAQEMTDAARYPLNIGDIIRCKDPWECPAPILPVLAWERSTDLWDSSWDLTKKRSVTASAIALQKMKGTYAGIEAYVKTMGAKVLQIDAPPMIAFPGNPMTDAQRAQWLSQFPQLRSYNFSTYGNSQYALFLTTMKVVALDGSNVYTATTQPLTDDNGNPLTDQNGNPFVAESGGLPGTWAGSAQVATALSPHPLTDQSGNPLTDSNGNPLTGESPTFCPIPDQACLLSIDMTKYLGNKTFLYEDGVQKLVDVYTTTIQGADGVMTDYNQAVIPGNLQDALFLDDWQLDVTTNRPVVYGGNQAWFLTKLDVVAVRTVTTLEDQVDYGSDNLVFTSAPVHPGLTPITVKPVTVFQDGPTHMADTYLGHAPTLPGQPAVAYVVNKGWGYFLDQDMARFNIYTMMYLYDPTQGAAPLKMPLEHSCFLDYDYFEFPAYTAKVVVEMFGTIPPPAMLVWYTGGYTINPDMTFMWDVVNSVRAAKSARDLILVDTMTYSIATPNVALLCGSITCGQATQILNA